MQSLTRAAVLALAAAALALTGCKTTEECTDCGEGCCEEGEAATLSVSNETCPFSGEPVKASVQTVAFNGQEIGFCCNGCSTKFAAMSDADKATLLAE